MHVRSSSYLRELLCVELSTDGLPFPCASNGKIFLFSSDIFFLGLLMSQFTLTGYDASAHMTEVGPSAGLSSEKIYERRVSMSISAGLLTTGNSPR